MIMSYLLTDFKRGRLFHTLNGHTLGFAGRYRNKILKQIWYETGQCLN